MYQKLIIIGNLGREPEMRYTPAGDPVTTFSVATSRKFGEKDESGNPTVFQRKDGSWGASYEVTAETVRFLSSRDDEPADVDVPFYEDEMSEKSDWEQGYDQAQRRFYEERKVLTDRIAELEAAQKWHVVADGDLPIFGKSVMFYDPHSREIYRGVYTASLHWQANNFSDKGKAVTHWMPLPESPNDTQIDALVCGKESEE